MLTLRLARRGTKKRPVYHLVAADRRARRDGRFVENLGYYIPGRNVLVVKQDRVDYWLGVGAQATETAHHLIRRARKHGNREPVAKPKYTPPPSKAKPAEKKKPADEVKAAESKKGGAKAKEGGGKGTAGGAAKKSGGGKKTEGAVKKTDGAAKKNQDAKGDKTEGADKGA